MIRQRNKLRIAVSGPTGTGKSSFVREMSRRSGVCAVLEPEPVALHDTLGGTDSGNLYELQRAIMLGRLHSEQLCGSCKIIVRDRSVIEDFHIFVAMFFAAGFLTALQHAKLRKLSDDICLATGHADAHILLGAENAVQLNRIQTAGAPQLIVDMLANQNQLYETWYASLIGPRLLIDTTLLRLSDIAARSEWALSTVSRACEGEYLIDRTLNLAWTSVCQA
jgi:deoxyadenosine/deoxycytidine kinase